MSQAAPLILGVAGAAIGAATGLPMGAQVGWMIGSAIGGALFPEQREGPRLSDLRVQRSSYGGMLSIIYGRMRTPGNFIWQTDLREHEENSGGKGGGAETTTYSYSASFAIGLCEGPIAEVRRVWANSRLVWDIEQDNGDFAFTLYIGDEEQLPDPTMEAEIGAGQVPAYRGTAYVVFTDLMLTEFGNTIPNLEFEVVTKGITGCAMSEVRKATELPISWGQATPDDTYHQPVFTGGGVVDGQFRLTSHNVGGGDLGQGPPSAATDTFITYLYDFDTLEPVEAAEVPDPFPRSVDTIGNDMPDNPGFASDVRSDPLGMYTMASGTIEPLWFNAGHVVSANGVDPAIVLSDVTALPDAGAISGYNGNHQYSARGDFAYLAGVPAGRIVRSAAFSGNNRDLYLFTNDPEEYPDNPELSMAARWWKIRNGVVVDDGPINPPWDPAENNPSGMWGNGGINGGIAVDNSGKFLWRYSWTLSRLEIYSFDPASGNLALDTECGTLTIPMRGSGGQTGALNAYATGYVAVAARDTLYIATWIPEGGDSTLRLWEIVRDVCVRCDLDDYDIDVEELQDIVDGYIVTGQGSGRGMIEPLQRAYFFDGAEIDDMLAFRKRGRDRLFQIPDGDLAARVDGDDPPAPLTLVRTQELDLPRFLNLNYINGEADYQTGTQIAERQVTRSDSKLTVTVPVVLTDDKAKAVASSNLIEAHLERDKGAIFLPRKYARVTPTDVIGVKGRDWRVKQVLENRPGVFRLDIVPTLPAIYVQPQKSAPAIGIGADSPLGDGDGTITRKALTDALLLDIPFITEAEFPNGFYAAMAPADSGAWGGASLQKSNDGGASYAEVAQTTVAATIGLVEGPLGDWLGGNTVDTINTAIVVLQSGELSGTDNLGLLNGARVALLGEEVVYYRDAELIEENTYELGGFLRGRRGTEWAMQQHEGAERFVLLTTLDVDAPLVDLKQERLYKPVTLGATLDSATAQAFTNRGMRLRPYAPVHLGGGVNASGGTILEWIPRTRIGGLWLDGGGPPLGEASERYIVEIWDASYTQCARIITVDNATTTTYASAVADFGANQQTIFFTVALVGAVLGVRARGTAPGAGVSNTAPLSPIPPYQTGPLNPPPSGVVNLTLSWGTETYFTPFAIGQTFVAQFTAGASVSTMVTAQAHGTPPPDVVRHVKLCTDAEGLNMVPGTEMFASWAWSGPVVLTASTTYYFIVRAENADGTPSGPLGQSAPMMISLTHD